MTGVRMGELIALRWRDVDWSSGRVRVRRSHVRGKYVQQEHTAGPRRRVTDGAKALRT
jgi:integrase